LVTDNPGTVMRKRIDTLFRQKGASLNIRLETPNIVIACELTAHVLCVSVLDRYVARSSMKPGMVIRPLSPQLTLRYVFFFPRWRTRTQAVNRLAELVELSADRANETARSALDAG
jgi:DNA-binding transcriptional LysR family regulator